MRAADADSVRVNNDRLGLKGCFQVQPLFDTHGQFLPLVGVSFSASHWAAMAYTKPTACGWSGR